MLLLQTHGREMKDFHIHSKQQKKMDLLNFIHRLPASLSTHAWLTHFPELIQHMGTTSLAAAPSILLSKSGSVAVVEPWPSSALPHSSAPILSPFPPSAINALLQPGLTSKPTSPNPPTPLLPPLHHPSALKVG